MAHLGNRRSFDEVRGLPAFHELLPHIASIITIVCADGDSKRTVPERSVFEGLEPAPTSAHDYLVRMCKYGHCSPWVFPCMLIFMDRFRMYTDTVLTSFNVHRLMLTCFVVAAKLRDDVYYANKYYASIGGVALRDMNTMEAVFLTYVDWDLHVSRQSFEACLRAIKRIATAGGSAPAPPGCFGGHMPAPAASVPRPALPETPPRRTGAYSSPPMRPGDEQPAEAGSAVVAVRSLARQSN
eukprot:TRINITY_DN8476_c0_g1_i1.p1 TRINITY_DN8476_c0_g1~~TRINITY_DN8476_c0_g1_i1.p1  ORF type:complete len:240 (+),score=35.54 TRINITY_DN8476_c0_g1_i1:116-835(+)